MNGSLLSGWLQPAVIGVVLALLLIAYAMMIERFWLEERTIRVTVERLPKAFSGLRIVLLSDLHLGVFFRPRHLDPVVDRVNRDQPDLVCLTGDLFYGKSGWGYEKAVQQLSRLQAKKVKLAVLGNHDHAVGRQKVRATLEDGGFQLLVNDNLMLEQGGDQLFIAGLDDILEGAPNLEAAMQNVPEDACSILLVHEPDFADHVKDHFRVDLQLSGHSHGGQFCLPWIGPLITSRMGKKYLSGLYRINGMQLVTTRGIGTTLLPLRFLCRPEITILELESLK